MDKKGWDEELSGDERRKYEVFMSEVAKLQNVTVPRCYFLKGKKVKMSKYMGSQTPVRMPTQGLCICVLRMRRGRYR